MKSLVDFHGMPAAQWESRDGARAIATLQGAHLVSWVPAGGDEALYLSERSPFEVGRAIRGGIPIAFPQFADRGPLAQHGFARTAAWHLAGLREEGARTSATFALESSPATIALWPHPFRMELIATVGGARLEVALAVANTGDTAFAFTAALHTYFRVADAMRSRLEGLRGVSFLTRGAGGRDVEGRDAIPAGDPIDRTYFAPPPSLQLHDPRRALCIAQEGFTDTVVWNPGAERAASMPDMPPDGYRHMLCVEAAAVEPAVALAPGATWRGMQEVTIA